MRPAVFFDRDGTLMEDARYCGDPARVKVFPGVPEALRRLKQAGFAWWGMLQLAIRAKLGKRGPKRLRLKDTHPLGRHDRLAG